MNGHMRLTAATLLVLLAGCSASGGDIATRAPAATSTAPMPSVASPSATVFPSIGSGKATASAEPTRAADALLDRALTDVRTGETFTLAQLAASEGPVLLEPMAIWCSKCLEQQRNVTAAHGSGAFTSVSLDVDLSEASADLAGYAEREGFDWHFVMADAELYRLLQERFGIAATNPPSTPLVVIERDGTVRPLEFGAGIRSAEQLLAELGAS
jgi:hypothetical protein